MEIAVETHALRKTYGKLIAVNDLDLRVPTGAVFGLLGPNGAGKTTTIQMLLGNVFATSGAASLFGMHVGDLRAKRRIGFLPEKFQFHDFLSAEEFLHFHGRLAGVDWAVLHRRTEEALEMVGLMERRRSKIREFSKGMQQRIGLAQAIVHDPDLVILDEPTSALDPIGRRHVRDIIGELKRRGKTVMLNSHLLSEVELSCDSLAIINKGSVIRQGSLDELLTTKSTVELEVRNFGPETERRICEFATLLSREGDAVTVEVGQDEHIPALAEAVVQTGAKLMQMTYKRETLEDFFIRSIEESGVSPTN